MAKHYSPRPSIHATHRRIVINLQRNAQRFYTGRYCWHPTLRARLTAMKETENAKGSS